jgi:hypothetical protein
VYARLVSFSDVDTGKREQQLKTIRETVLPTLRQFDGFAGYIGLYDESNARAKALLLWESAETADAAEEKLVGMRARITSEMGMTVDSADLYEAAVVELEGARV